MDFLRSSRSSYSSSEYRITHRVVPDDPELILVAVQGLWAHPDYTWEKNGVSWLSQFLPQDIPGLLVTTFGPSKSPTERSGWVLKIASNLLRTSFLPTLLAGLLARAWRKLLLIYALTLGTTVSLAWMDKYVTNLSTTRGDDIEQLANGLLADLDRLPRHLPIVLLGHSLGGLIVKQAFVSASQRSSHEQLVPRLRGLIFLGTPHSGAPLARLLSLSTFDSSFALISALQVNSRYLEELDRLFRQVVPPDRLFPRVVSVFEERRGMFFVRTVGQESASLSGYRAESLDTNHSQLVKFSRRDDPNYQKLLAAIKYCAGQI
ncbi:unnamed protein product [Zymoseptoria tritici ST99CH_3D7]|uniref:Uncharacterized protein n=1 Tax=Zymoseptoria tritici (strain ST99CH_3D7) TaxID=1276538 RepID=A0A1X7RR58_ZYMT9|nr:unnamed protein product [Zymoseptoria tritici ST99CH_3D7]